MGQSSLPQQPCDTRRQLKFDNSLLNKENYFRESVAKVNNFVSSATGLAASSDIGKVRKHNEDRVALLQVPTRATQDGPPSLKLNFLAVYDGHGGTSCSEYLQDNLHKLVLGSPHFPKEPEKALFLAFLEAESMFLTKAVSASTPEEFEEDIDSSGSCAVVMLIIGSMCYVANLGDSRVIASYSHGQEVIQITEDLKPSLEFERDRIILAGGKVYQNVSYTSVDPESLEPIEVYGPARVLPGRLSVSRSFGDVDAKDPRLGGKKGVVIATPQIHTFEITDELDFVIIGSDGIFDQMDNQEVVQMSWNGIEAALDNIHVESLDELCYWAVEEIMSQSLLKGTQDNISTILACFKSLPDMSESMNVQRALRRLSSQANPPNLKNTANT